MHASDTGRDIKAIISAEISLAGSIILDILLDIELIARFRELLAALLCRRLWAYVDLDSLFVSVADGGCLWARSLCLRCHRAHTLLPINSFVPLLFKFVLLIDSISVT